jgi:hypothetical protein
MLHRVVSLALLAALPLAAARAETTYATLAGNLGATGQANGSIQFFPLGGTTFAQRFTTGTLPAIGDGDSSGQILYRFGWDLLPAQAFDPINENFSNLDTTYAVNLFTDAAGAPGSSLLALGPATGTLSAPGVVEFFSTPTSWPIAASPCNRTRRTGSRWYSNPRVSPASALHCSSHSRPARIRPAPAPSTI